MQALPSGDVETDVVKELIISSLAAQLYGAELCGADLFGARRHRVGHLVD